MKPAWIVTALFLLPACGAVRSYREMQMANDMQEMMRKYKTCVDVNANDPASIEQLCKPYLALLPATATTMRHPNITSVYQSNSR